MPNPDPSDLHLVSDPDTLFLNGVWPKPFEFDAEVARVFDDMVSRSVPLYRDVLVSAAQWAIAYYQPQTKLVDVGCSTGTFLEFLGRMMPEPAQLVGLDSAQPMIDRAQEKLAPLSATHTLELVCGSATDYSFAHSSVVIMNYTLQFLPLKQRRSLLLQIYQGLEPGGLLYLSEKVVSPFPQLQETIMQQYERFKVNNGYAQREVERKKEALEQVLVPLSEPQLRDLLQASGFTTLDSLIKQHNFMTFVALKNPA
ncbi:methyltransferase domain-containing protein [Lyngbya confervoides]|uniref:Carboxy-S-adenosyl-L-methionine synthase n=1 Tax=Lyngbya confervoides BDU141951 TaxID=1574623 RepID=A0ABD4T7S3_9CYAN|nr:methyltransferase domain-containing protein [Lyngbya confervoides]MCM1984596.1 methyltransferase domain-containing protein [Lyngbya confervoides BDU141951]